MKTNRIPKLPRWAQRTLLYCSLIVFAPIFFIAASVVVDRCLPDVPLYPAGHLRTDLVKTASPESIANGREVCEILAVKSSAVDVARRLAGLRGQSAVFTQGQYTAPHPVLPRGPQEGADDVFYLPVSDLASLLAGQFALADECNAKGDFSAAASLIDGAMNLCVLIVADPHYASYHGGVAGMGLVADYLTKNPMLQASSPIDLERYLTDANDSGRNLLYAQANLFIGNAKPYRDGLAEDGFSGWISACLFKERVIKHQVAGMVDHALRGEPAPMGLYQNINLAMFNDELTWYPEMFPADLMLGNVEVEQKIADLVGRQAVTLK